MIDIGFPLYVIDLIRKLYVKQQSVIRTVAGTTDWFKVAMGVRQGCILNAPLPDSSECPAYSCCRL